MGIIKRAVNKIVYPLKLKKLRKRLTNKSPCVISSNCNGAFMLHDLGVRFNTPTVNLLFKAGDYLKFVSDPKKYFDADLVETNVSGISYPVGQLLDIRLFFMHYKSFDDAKAKWDERKKRVDLNDTDNIYLIFTDKDGCTYDDLKTFDALPYKHKVVFTHKPYPEIKSAFYIKGFEDKGEVGVLSDVDPKRFIKSRYFEQFDYVSFFNS